MRLSDVLCDTETIRAECAPDTEISGITVDSRKVKPGFLFIAIRGFETDGNKYIGSALEKGAVAVVTDDESVSGVPCVLVGDARRTCAEIARNFYGRPTDSMKLIGVTGTNGKTTVTYLIKQILENLGSKCGLIGTNQNMIGNEVTATDRTTPEACELWELFAKMKEAECDYVIMEVSSHSLALSRVFGIEYEVGVFTNLTQDHLDFHKTMEEYEATKASFFKQCKTGVVNFDDEAGKRILAAKETNFISYSAVANSADFVAKNIRLKPSAVEFEMVGIGILARIKLNIPGEFSVYNALAASTALIALSVELPTIAGEIKNVSGVPGRAEIVPTPREYTVMIDYAHSPDGLENILKTVKQITDGRVIALFGCGGDRDRTKRPKMGAIAEKYADILVVTSDNPRTEEPDAIIADILEGIERKDESLIVIPDRREAIFKALSIAEDKDIILLAGKGHETYQEINHVKHHMDEREIIAEYFVGR